MSDTDGKKTQYKTSTGGVIIMRTATTKSIIAGDMGSGALEFRQELTEGLDVIEAMGIIADMMSGKLPEGYEDNRLKRCETCDYHFYDNTRPRNKLVCSPECKKVRDAGKLREKIAEERRLDPSKRPRATMKEKYYADHLEYSFWIERSPEDYAKSYETPHGDNLEEIYAAIERDEMMGGRRVNTNVNYYEGNWSNGFSDDDY